MSLDWMRRAQCRGMSTEVFFAAPHQGRDPYTEARALCAQCPVTGACLADTLQLERYGHLRHGFRAGMTPNEREAYAQKSKRIKHPRISAETSDNERRRSA